MKKVGSIGLGNVGSKAAGSMLRSGFELSVRDLDRAVAEPLLEQGAHWAESPGFAAEMLDDEPEEPGYEILAVEF